MIHCSCCPLYPCCSHLIFNIWSISGHFRTFQDIEKLPILLQYYIVSKWAFKSLGSVSHISISAATISRNVRMKLLKHYAWFNINALDQNINNILDTISIPLKLLFHLPFICPKQDFFMVKLKNYQ